MKKEERQNLTYAYIRNELLKDWSAGFISVALSCGAALVLTAIILLFIFSLTDTSVEKVIVTVIFVLLLCLYGYPIFASVRYRNAIKKNRFSVLSDKVTAVKPESAPERKRLLTRFFVKKSKKLREKLEDKLSTDSYTPDLRMEYTSACTVFLEKCGYYVGDMGTENYFDAGDTVYAVYLAENAKANKMYDTLPMKTGNILMLYNAKMYDYKE